MKTDLEPRAPAPIARELGDEWEYIRPGETNGYDFPNIMNQQVLAAITVGGAQTSDGKYHVEQTIYLLKISDEENPDFQALVRRAEASNTHPAGFMLAAMDPRSPEPRLRGMAFLDGGHHPDRVGRQGTLAWFKYDDSPVKNTGFPWSPFDDNPSVAREQFHIVANSSDTVSIKGMPSKLAGTKVLGPDIRPHKSPKKRRVETIQPITPRLARAASLLISRVRG